MEDGPLALARSNRDQVVVVFWFAIMCLSGNGTLVVIDKLGIGIVG